MVIDPCDNLEALNDSNHRVSSVQSLHASCRLRSTARATRDHRIAMAEKGTAGNYNRLVKDLEAAG